MTENRMRQFDGEGGLMQITKSYKKYGVHKVNDHYEYQ